jgi:hypothetical protein
MGIGETPNKAAADFEEKWKTNGLTTTMYSGPAWEKGIKPEKPAPPKPAAPPPKSATPAAVPASAAPAPPTQAASATTEAATTPPVADATITAPTSETQPSGKPV